MSLQELKDQLPILQIQRDIDLEPLLNNQLNPGQYQNYRKIFDGVQSVQVDSEQQITGLISNEGELLPLTQAIQTKNQSSVQWLTNLQEFMKLAVQESIQKALNCGQYKTNKLEWIKNHTGQAVQTAETIQWTQKCEKAITQKNLEGFLESINKQLSEYVLAIREEKIDEIQKIKLSNGIIQHVNFKEIVEQLIQQKVTSLDSQQWSSQFKLYVNKQSNQIEGIIDNQKIEYGNYYVGNYRQLVITPLTRQVYQHIFKSFSEGKAFIAYGPAGTGKTESIKDLSRQLGKQSVVYNCSDEFDKQIINNVLTSSLKTGCWAIFDEANRIQKDVSLYFSQILKSIVQAKGQQNSNITIDGKQIQISKNFNVGLTFNPGYSGSLEEVLVFQECSNSIAMTVPDYERIIQVILLHNGFMDGRSLCNGFYNVFKLCEQKLSKQKFYDFGLRQIMQTSVFGGCILRKNQYKEEKRVLKSALKYFSVPKFTENDLSIFENILNDQFPNIEILPPQHNQQLVQAIQQQLVEKQDQQIQAKVLQLYDIAQVRHGLLLIGSTKPKHIIETLVKSKLTLKDQKEFEQVKLHYTEYKSQDQFYGDNQNLGEFSKLLKQTACDTSEDQHWLIIEKEVENVWIENLNTCLDDNKILCVNNGERIKLSPKIRIVIISPNANNASPAFISRCGVLNCE